MINTDFILVRDGEKTHSIATNKLARDHNFHIHSVSSAFTERLRTDLIAIGFTVTVLDRATMTREEQREVFMLTRDASFYSYENLRWLIERADRADELEDAISNISIRIFNLENDPKDNVAAAFETINRILSNLLTPPDEKQK